MCITDQGVVTADGAENLVFRILKRFIATQTMRRKEYIPESFSDCCVAEIHLLYVCYTWMLYFNILPCLLTMNSSDVSSALSSSRKKSLIRAISRELTAMMISPFRNPARSAGLPSSRLEIMSPCSTGRL